MERLEKPRHRREGRRLSERKVSESNPAKLPESYATGFLDSARNDFYDSTPTNILDVNPFRKNLKESAS
jgi:hypothetical protein